MAINVKASATSFDPLPTDKFLHATVEAVELVPNSFEPDGAQRIKFTFSLSDHPGRKQWKTVSQSWSSRPGKLSRLYELAHTLDPNVTPDTEEYDAEDLVGAEARLLLEDYTRQDGVESQRIAKIAAVTPTKVAL